MDETTEEDQATNQGLSEVQQRFVDDLGQQYARYGMAPTFGRVFALLLISDEPLSLDELAARLGISKTQASVATRDLERLGGARRLATPGSRRVRYEAGDDTDAVFWSQLQRIRASREILMKVEPGLPQGKGRDRLSRMRELHDFWLSETELIREKWRRKGRETGE